MPVQEQHKKIDAVYRDTVKSVYRYVYSRVGRKEWTEDIVSDTYMALLSVIDKYDGVAKIETFVIGIARNKILQYWQKLKSQNVSFDETLFVLPDQDAQEDNQKSEREEINSKKLKVVLDLLNPKYREILKLRFIDSMSIKETAKKTKTSDANVRVLQHRALKQAAKIASTMQDKLNNNQNDKEKL